MMYKVIVLIAAVVFLGAGIDLNMAIFDQKMKIPKGVTKPQTLLNMAKSFEGNPYQAHTLEKQPEGLVVNLRELDCFTFVESVVALTQARYHSAPKYYHYQQYLTKLRYRNGQIDGYASRLHYFWEWALQAQKTTELRDVTKSLGGDTLRRTINFMTTHRAAYPSLAQDDSAFVQIQAIEKKLSETTGFYIPQNRIKDIESQLQDGDLVGITSNIVGLDFNHEGFIVKKDGRAYLLHASTEKQKVMLSSETLADYLNRVKKHAGIVVLRVAGR